MIRRRNVGYEKGDKVFRRSFIGDMRIIDDPQDDWVSFDTLKWFGDKMEMPVTMYISKSTGYVKFPSFLRWESTTIFAFLIMKSLAYDRLHHGKLSKTDKHLLIVAFRQIYTCHMKGMLDEATTEGVNVPLAPQRTEFRPSSHRIGTTPASKNPDLFSNLVS